MTKRKQFYHPPVDPRDERIKRLEDELWGVRDDIVRLMPEVISDLLSRTYLLETRSDYHRWQRETIDAIVEMTVPDPKASNRYEVRARCPLCQASGDVYGSGFKLPLGLERHLEGWGNVSQCPVTEAAFKNARYSNRDKFDKAEEAERDKVEQRKATERVLLINPAEKPVLFDERLWSREPRNPEQLAVAEQRLRDLGFEIETNGNIVAYKFVHEEWLVLADPRGEGRIEFTVFKRSGKKQKRRFGRDQFYLLDSWSVDLPGKFHKRLRQSCEDATQ
jgi:hypothetical protein